MVRRVLERSEVAWPDRSGWPRSPPGFKALLSPVVMHFASLLALPSRPYFRGETAPNCVICMPCQAHFSPPTPSPTPFLSCVCAICTYIRVFQKIFCSPTVRRQVDSVYVHYCQRNSGEIRGQTEHSQLTGSGLRRGVWTAGAAVPTWFLLTAKSL